MKFFRNIRDPGFWKWAWKHKISFQTKAILAVASVVAILGLGFVGAQKITPDDEEIAFTEQVVTVTRTVLVKGKPRVVTEIRTIRQKLAPKTVTVRRNGRQVVITAPGETVV